MLYIHVTDNAFGDNHVCFAFISIMYW